LSQSLDKLEAKEFETKANAKTASSRSQDYISRSSPRTYIVSLNCSWGRRQLSITASLASDSRSVLTIKYKL